MKSNDDPLFFLRNHVQEIEALLGYSFRDSSLLERAFTHKSYFYEHPATSPVHNEKLEFLGDAILHLWISEKLYMTYPDRSEGELTQMRAILVDESSLAKYSERMGLCAFLILGKGERQREMEKRPSLMANLFEAVLAILYLDGGFNPVSLLLSRCINKEMMDVCAENAVNKKNQLQEWAQKKFHVIPEYVVVRDVGLDHEKWFVVSVSIGQKVFGHGEGFSKKKAEMQAAENAMKKIVEMDGNEKRGADSK